MGRVIQAEPGAGWAQVLWEEHTGKDIKCSSEDWNVTPG